MTRTPVHTLRLIQLVRAVERDAHRRGWDSPPQLSALIDTSDPAAADWGRHIACGPPTRVEHYTAVPFVPADMLAPDPARVLYQLAMRLRHAAHHPDTAALRQRLNGPGLLGLAVLAEGWQHPDPANRVTHRRAGRRAADLPGACEWRITVAAAVNAATVHVARVRGQQPVTTLVTDNGASGDGSFGGLMVAALRTIVAAVTDQSPPSRPAAGPAGPSTGRSPAGGSRPGCACPAGLVRP